jgi:hypothetical protein
MNKDKPKNTGNAGKGRKKGAKNKTPTTLKNAFLEAFESIGGVQSLQAWAEDNKTEFYKIMSKILPKELELTGAGGGPIRSKVEIVFAGHNHAS